MRKFTWKTCRKMTALILTLMLGINGLFPLETKADSATIELKKEYSETGTKDCWSFETATSNLKEDTNCRLIKTSSAGRIKITGTSSADVRLYLFSHHGAKEMENYSTNQGTFSVYANVEKGTHYLKFWLPFGEKATITYKVTFSPNKIYKKKNKSLQFNKYNKEYLRGCDFASAISNAKSSTNCRKIVLSSKKKLKLSAYSLGDSNTDIRVYIYKSTGKCVLRNWSVSDGTKSTTIKMKKGTYYMKFWECFGKNAEFHYRLKKM